MKTPIFHDEIQCLVALPSIIEKKDFVILTPANVVALMPFKVPTRTKFVIEIDFSSRLTRFVECYTPEELALGGQKNDQGKRPICEG